MRRLLLILMIVVSAMLAATLAVMAVVYPRTSAAGAGAVGGASAALTPDSAVEDLAIPAFTMRDQDGREVTGAVFDGRVTIVDFIFTDCPSICPIMNAVMSEIAGRLAGTPVRFVSISVNPERDTPERLKEYGSHFTGGDFSRWTFLTGDWETAQKIVRDGLGFLLRRDPDATTPMTGGAEGTTYNVTHPGKLILVGPQRQVLTWADYNFENEVKAIENRARAAAATLK